MNVNLWEIRIKTVSVKDYIENLEEPFREKFLTRKQTYLSNQEAVNKLKNLAKEYVIVAFSAEWCKDCASNIPVLALLSEIIGLEVRIFGGLVKDPLSHTKKWRIPPSPPEVETFQVDKVPFMMVFDKNGVEIGKIIENPKRMPTLEQEILQIISEHATN